MATMTLSSPSVMECCFMGSGLPPTKEGFMSFLRGVAGIPVEALPDGAPVIDFAYCQSLTLALCLYQAVGGACADQPSYYAMVVYNLATHILVVYAMDDPNAEDPYKKYWTILREKMGLNSFTPGVIQSSSDNGTSVSFMVPEWMNNMTMADLQYLKTPWGRNYMGLAQAYGPTIWGIS